MTCRLVHILFIWEKNLLSLIKILARFHTISTMHITSNLRSHVISGNFIWIFSRTIPRFKTCLIKQKGTWLPSLINKSTHWLSIMREHICSISVFSCCHWSFLAYSYSKILIWLLINCLWFGLIWCTIILVINMSAWLRILLILLVHLHHALRKCCVFGLYGICKLLLRLPSHKITLMIILCVNCSCHLQLPSIITHICISFKLIW